MTINKVFPAAISIKDIRDEWNDTGSTSLNEFYGQDINLPKSGTISLKDFYGATNIFPASSSQLGIEKTFAVNDYDILAACAQLGWNRYSKLNITLGSECKMYATARTSACMVFQGSSVLPITVNNFGVIMGRGGPGASGTSAARSGGDAIVTSMSSGSGTINFYNYGYVLAGGGGGGGMRVGEMNGGGGGGAGGGGGGNISGDRDLDGGRGGSFGSQGRNGIGDYPGGGGLAGGGGGGWAERKGTDAVGSGGGGGRYYLQNATGGAGSNTGARGGSFSSDGGSASNGGGGGGGYARRGGNSSTSGARGGSSYAVSSGTFNFYNYGYAP